MSLLGSGLAGDIWSNDAFSFESPLKDLLDSGDYTIEQLLAEDELLQEIRGNHPQLINFFSTSEAVAKLVEYVILPTGDSRRSDSGVSNVGTGDGDKWLDDHFQRRGETVKEPEKIPEIKHIRFPYMACEIICCEINSVINVLVDGKVPAKIENGESRSGETETRILDMLFSLLYDTPSGELDDYRAGYFDKILTVLFRKRPEDLVKYINEGGTKGTHFLMEAVFSHLYSHSIMQIAQRLMLPQRPTPPPPPPDESGAEIMAEEQAFEEDLAVYCDWSKSSHALDKLLLALIDPSVPSAPETKEERDEFLLDLSLHASEVLITVIQNSMLSSETMLSLTTTETVKRLVLAATTLRTEKGETPFFSPHESLLTSAMNVLESLILQLGGYGAVGTMFLLPDEEGGQLMEGELPEDQQHLIADLGSVVEHLPQLLSEMSALLRHESTKKWTSFMQFSTSEPQQLLGNSRLRIVRVLESLVLLGDPNVDAKLIESDCLSICLDLFWEFQWCSMLHQSVANLLVHVFEGHNARVGMQVYFLVKCNLLGRLMESFMELDERIPEVVSNLASVDLPDQTGGSKIPVSEDDIDAALERQNLDLDAAQKDVVVSNVEQLSTEAVHVESRDASTIGAPSQSFRFGYMGHVIIICQALVHACSNEMEIEDMQNGEYVGNVELENQEPLMLAELVSNHELSERWNEFVLTTLASETAIQSTPLGGYETGHDPLHAHRPGLVDDGDIMGDDGMGPPAPPRGIGGIDMDENDLDVAASMMAGMSLTGQRQDSDGETGSLESGDSDKSYNSGETASDRTGYAFDDPLGKADTLGIELGKLTKYQADETSKTSKQAQSANELEDDMDDSSGSSSDEEQSPGNSGGVPVMDLFAGNFDYNQREKTGAKQAEQTAGFSDFANFDDADDEFGDFESATPSAGGASIKPASEVEDLFAVGDPVDPMSLLAADISPVKASPLAQPELADQMP